MEIILRNLGFDSFFESHCDESRVGFDCIARVIAEHKGRYIVRNSSGEFDAKITGKKMFTATSRDDYPVVGDWVVIKIIDERQAIIERILPRKTLIKKTEISRKSTGRMNSQIIAANVDTAFIVESVDRDFSLNRFERYFALVRDGNVEPSIIFNKADLISKNDLDTKKDEISARFNCCKVISTSTKSLEGLDDLRKSLLPGKTYCFLGSSGVGKSSLINALAKQSVAKTGVISQSTGRGRHVTTHRKLYPLDSGGIVIDNPGTREVGLANSEVGIETVFDEIENLAMRCKFTNCSHVQESGCAVLKALESGTLDEDRYYNYIRLKKELEHYELTWHEERDKEKKFGKQIKDYHKRIEKFE